MNKTTKARIYTDKLRNNRRSYAEKTNRIIMKTKYKHDTNNVPRKQRSSFKKNAAATSSFHLPSDSNTSSVLCPTFDLIQNGGQSVT